MQIAIKKVYKAEIQENLLLAKAQIDQLLLDAEVDACWQVFHQHTQAAIAHLNDVSRLLAEQQITICLLSKNKQASANFLPEDINEIIKAYRYLN